MVCKSCGKTGHSFYQHYDGGYVCDACVGAYFTCPSCGKLYDMDDFEHGDAGTGKCVSCEQNSNDE
ncbi:hypothetical protein [Anaerotignum sp.]|uniref:hypothetical protein n=1 Tax=Anaerotignum sp. TaxID=2039241 RepID=UPI0027BB1CB4|nr:hypothetical protein [Anaerotignum sp.]